MHWLNDQLQRYRHEALIENVQMNKLHAINCIPCSRLTHGFPFPCILICACFRICVCCVTMLHLVGDCMWTICTQSGYTVGLLRRSDGRVAYFRFSRGSVSGHAVVCRAFLHLRHIWSGVWLMLWEICIWGLALRTFGWCFSRNHFEIGSLQSRAHKAIASGDGQRHMTVCSLYPHLVLCCVVDYFDFSLEFYRAYNVVEYE